VFAWEETIPAVALEPRLGAVVVVVLSVPAELSEDVDAVVDAVVAADLLPVVDAVWLAVVPPAAMQPASVTMAATLPPPMIRRVRRAGCGRRFRGRSAVSLRRGFDMGVMQPMIGPVPQRSL
jgi:hypothetical protein